MVRRAQPKSDQMPFETSTLPPNSHMMIKPNKTRPVQNDIRYLRAGCKPPASAALCLCKGLGEISNWPRSTGSVPPSLTSLS
eukprot:g61261.t1